MTTTPDEPTPREGDQPDTASADEAATGQDTRGAEIGMTEGEGSTFEPEEDPEGHQ